MMNDDKQIVLLTSMRNNNPELQYNGKKKIPVFSSSGGLKFVILVEDSDSAYCFGQNPGVRGSISPSSFYGQLPDY